ncbi:MFS transporter [Actinacidiphila oryziradicis]|uniref:MFS transporter n=1 Tax=Actinacidiphila oryziradicis TaxID=2571141 RepID=UPI0023F09602|nr:MFS transporter [Actinacidiphila oryziradicis]MCW2873292.1 yjjL 1 [Actinacidiphila oryziradicis]
MSRSVRFQGAGYRWVVLAAGVIAQAAAATVLQGLPSLAPVLRSTYGLSLPELGVVLGSGTAGLLLALVGWGILADRVGERWVMSAGLVLSALALFLASRAGRPVTLIACLVAAGAAGASVNAASGRAVLAWFPRAKRGLAMGLRQTAIPVGAAAAAVGLPAAARRWGLSSAFVCMAGVCLLGALVVVVLVREAPAEPLRLVKPVAPGPPPSPSSSRERGPVLVLCAVSLLLVVPQTAVVSFLVVYLVEGFHVSAGAAAGLLAVVQMGGGAARIGLGWWSDRAGLRLRSLGTVALAAAGLFAVLSLLGALHWVAAVPVMALAGVVAISWNGLAFTAVGELADPRRVGLVLGVQNTAVAAGMAVTPPALGALVERFSWGPAFAVVMCSAVLARLLLRGPIRAERGAAAAPPDSVVPLPRGNARGSAR